MSSSRPSRSHRNREIDEIDLGVSLAVLPAPADPSFSPLADVGRPIAEPPSTAVAEPRPVPAATPAGAKGHQATGDTAPGSRRRRRSSEPAVEAVRTERDETRDRLVREALVARGLDPEAYTKKAVPRGGKHRPTIELSPTEYAEIQIATAVRPDLFGGTLVSFVRACAVNWEAIAGALEVGHEVD